ncbi:MAG: hypothetical protein GW938_03395 [Leptospira sp.]|nr:hypothetical protein [Leptospira sp.]NCS95261.1 hypothetical protein [Leptospira sp.]
MNTKVDEFLVNGCMRCKLGATPDCKVNSWKEEILLLRKIVLKSELTEDLKWGFPCYTFNNKNIMLLSVFKEYCAIGFFKGSLLTDPKKILVKQGESSQASRILKFTDVKIIKENKNNILSYIREAIEIEKSGKKVIFKKNPEQAPDELIQKFKESPEFKKAFFALTPGRQRGYIIHFSQPKQSQTRISRIDKCTKQILAGIGLTDKYS